MLAQRSGASIPWLLRLRCRGPIPQRTVRPEVIILLPPPLHKDLRLQKRVEDFDILGISFGFGIPDFVLVGEKRKPLDTSKRLNLSGLSAILV